MTDRIELEITWRGAEAAELYYLLDGGMPVPLHGHQTVGHGSIRVQYDAPATGLHVLEWGLTFPGKKLSDLKATATVNGGADRDLEAKSEASHKWTGDGEAY